LYLVSLFVMHPSSSDRTFKELAFCLKTGGATADAQHGEILTTPAPLAHPELILELEKLLFSDVSNHCS
jgi:hypothetical protein